MCEKGQRRGNHVSWASSREKLWPIRSIHREVVGLTYIASGREGGGEGEECEGVRGRERERERERELR